ncbi:hypothetical protein BJ742DRAFT_804539 [Cladochytrium replicatum]|nr:hypothetical protein BJ742DRAFT_804539 [Cladochytrium replicatum]
MAGKCYLISLFVLNRFCFPELSGLWFKVGSTTIVPRTSRFRWPLSSRPSKCIGQGRCCGFSHPVCTQKASNLAPPAHICRLHPLGKLQDKLVQG